MKKFTTSCGIHMTYSCLRRNRKTAELRMDPEKGLLVIVPRQWAQVHVEKLLEEKKRWIVEKKEMFLHREQSMPSFALEDGKHLLLGGSFYPLRIVFDSESRPFLSFDGEEFLLTKQVHNRDDQLRTLVKNWFKEHAQELLEEKVALYQEDIGGAPLAVKAKEQRKRWGSCTGENKLLFNWRLVFAPEFVVEAVAVHELCHMIHKNHSRQFWDLVYTVYPGYSHSKEWLRNRGYELFWMG